MSKYLRSWGDFMLVLRPFWVLRILLSQFTSDSKINNCLKIKIIPIKSIDNIKVFNVWLVRKKVWSLSKW